MASPQTENGYTKIANEIYDALIRHRIAGEARQVLDFIIRKTYGFNKKEDQIALSQFCNATGLTKAHICHSINYLLQYNLIANKGNNRCRKRDIQKTVLKENGKGETLKKLRMQLVEKNIIH